MATGVTDEYKRDKLKNWNPDWNVDTIKQWSGSQLDVIYRREQQKVVNQIYQENGIVDYRTS